MQALRASDFEPAAPPLAQPRTALERILAEAPYHAHCSLDKTAAHLRPRHVAMKYPYMQINREGFVSWLIFDLDHRDAFIWDSAGLPAPNLIVSNPKTCTAHLFYAIAPVCTGVKARAKPIAYMKAIYTAFAKRLSADPDYHSGPVAKTPGHPWWRTTELHNEVYELGKLADYVDLPLQYPWGKPVDLESVSHSRHCMMFERVRRYAYTTVNHERENGNFEGFNRALRAYAESNNSFVKLGFKDNLPLSSIKATVKSVARWTWERYKGRGGCNRGVMQLSPALPLHVRQRLSAQRTHGVRCTATDKKIKAAIQGLSSDGIKATQATLAKRAKVTRQTIAAYQRRHSQQGLQPYTPSNVMHLNDYRARVQARTTPNVKYGVYQVTAPPVKGKKPTNRAASPAPKRPPSHILDG